MQSLPRPILMPCEKPPQRTKIYGPHLCWNRFTTPDLSYTKPRTKVNMKSSNEPYKKVAYEPLASSTVSIPSSPPHWRSKLLHFGAGGLTTLLIALAVFAIQRVAFAPATTAEIEAEAWNYCGRSSVVARERGCVMEPLFYGWMPPACVFPELTAAHPVFEDRPWYRDKNMTIALRPEELWAGAHTMIYTPR